EGLDRAFTVRSLPDDDAVVLVLDVAAVAVEERGQEHVRVDLVRHAETDRVSDRLELRRPLAQVIPGPEAHACLLELTPPVLHPVGRVALGEPVELLRRRVVRALPRDPRHPADLLALLLHAAGA